ncbi:MAG TPA: polysaccharide deacetylase family protein [Acidobacteriaceae bacterium]|nr:polysaccharide deacetylase family protein [Acidobacteriaceae bacterium]
MLVPFAIGGAALLGAGGYMYAGMAPGSQIFGRTLVAGNDPDKFALTYDDGPNDACTEALLEVLARHEVKATFFMIGRFVRERAELVRRVRAAGHVVGNHTWTHPVLLLKSPARVREELTATSKAIEDILGERVEYFRPPFGARRPDVLRTARELGMIPVMWNAMGFDWKPTTAEKVRMKLARGIARNRGRGVGSNLLMHDGGQAGIGQDRWHTVKATENLLHEWRGRVRFVTVAGLADQATALRAIDKPK